MWISLNTRIETEARISDIGIKLQEEIAICGIQFLLSNPDVFKWNTIKSDLYSDMQECPGS
jgi:hypothetical protein